MSEFEMPSAEARAQSPELDRVCCELERQVEARQAAEMRNSPLAISLDVMSIWVESALKCPAWNWDPDQHAAASDCLEEAKALLADPSAGGAAISAKLDQLVKASRALRVAVGGDAPGDEPDVYADHDRLCDLLADCREAEQMSPGECLDQVRHYARLQAFDDAASCIENKHAKITSEGHDTRAPGMADAAKLVRNMAYIEKGGA